jgi:ABC-type glutathione transport system ATPase component
MASGAVQDQGADDRGTVRLESVRFAYRRSGPFSRGGPEVVRDVSLVVAKGQTLGLVGESGSGKSTIGRVALGVYPPTSGRVLFGGVPIGRQRRQLKGRFQVVLQNPEWSLNPRLRIGVSVAEPLTVAKIGTRPERRERVGEMLELVGLPEALAHRYPHELSGGQQQRVAIARALITQPDFVVFDEAVSALDVSVQAQTLNLIKSLQDAEGFAALFISHDMAAVRYVSDSVAVMMNGEIVESAPVGTFYGNPSHPYSRLLVNSTVPGGETAAAGLER